jgi:hypothetical protein
MNIRPIVRDLVRIYSRRLGSANRDRGWIEFPILRCAIPAA